MTPLCKCPPPPSTTGLPLLHLSAFDVLYVVDPFRDWYLGGDAPALDAIYHQRLETCVQGYGRVVMVGDSMGATAALLFSRLATAVLAFCPQVRG